jgi:AcrR family transcriptional regulator
MPRPSQKAEILAAALSCFAEHGYDGTRVRHIAERAGVAESALYRHYPSKEVLAQELFQQFIDRYARFLATVAASDRPPLDKLRGIVQMVLQTYRAQPQAFVFAVLSTHQRLPKVAQETTYPLDVVESVIVEGQRAGVVRAGQTNLLAAIFMGATLQPVVLAELSRPGAFELLTDTMHDDVIEASAIAAIERTSS